MNLATTRGRARAAALFHALSDETRLRIVERLQNGEQCVCDLTDAFRAGQSRLSFHLKVLKEAGLVTDRPAGRWTYYALNPEALEELEQLVHGVRKAGAEAARSDACCP